MKIGIIGFGRFGQVFARHLKATEEVFVTNKTDKRQEAEGQGLVWAEGDEIFASDVLIFCVPISELKNALAWARDKIRPGTTVLDVCSVKTNPCRWMEKALKPSVEILGTHPMFGPDSAKETMAGRQMILCPVRISDDSLEKLTKFFESFNLNVIVTTPEEHDCQTAKCLALTHFIGRSLEKTGIKEQDVSTLGFERLLRVMETVSHDTWQLFEDMHRFNPYAAEVRSQFIENLNQIDQQLKQKEQKDEND